MVVEPRVQRHLARGQFLHPGVSRGQDRARDPVVMAAQQQFGVVRPADIISRLVNPM